MDRARRAPPIPFPEGARRSQRPGKHSPAAGPDRPGNGFPVCASRPPGTESREPGSPGIGHPEAPTCSETPGLRSSGTGSPQKPLRAVQHIAAGVPSPAVYRIIPGPLRPAIARQSHCSTVYRPHRPSPGAPLRSGHIIPPTPRVRPFGTASPPGESSQQSPYRRSVRRPSLPPPVRHIAAGLKNNMFMRFAGNNDCNSPLNDYFCG